MQRMSWLLGLLFFAAWLVALPLARVFPVHYGDFGTRDFIQYWSAHNLVLRGENPYDPEAMLRLQRETGYSESRPVMLWNPPWTTQIMSIWITADFSISVWRWRLANILFVFLGSLIMCDRPRASFISGALTLFFYPVLDCMASGQVGIFLGVGIACLLSNDGHFEHIFRSYAAWIPMLVGLSILSIKPHLFLPVGIFFLSRKQSALLPLLALAPAVLFASIHNLPVTLGYWWNSLISPPHIEHAIPLSVWRGETFVAWARGITFDFIGWRGDPLMIVIPLIINLTLWIMLRRSRRASLCISLSTCCVLGLFSAPYGWMSDYAALFPLATLMFRADVMAISLGTILFAYFTPRLLHAHAFLISAIIHIILEQNRDQEG
jgi:hypothetical protein